MSQVSDALPPEIIAQLMKFVREVEGSFQVVDQSGFLNFLADHISEYPALGQLIETDMDAVVRHFEETGEVPPGIKLIKKTALSEKVTKVEVLRGPIPPRK